MTGATVAAAIEMDAPARFQDAAEAVAGGGSPGDPPAGGGHIGLHRLSRSQDQEEQACPPGGEVQAAALLERQGGIDKPGHGPEPLRMQALLHRLIDLRIGLDLEQQEPPRIEAEIDESMAVGRGMPASHDEDRLAFRLGEMARDQGQGEAQCGGGIRVGIGRDLVQAAEGETAMGKPRIDLGKAEGQAGRYD